MTADPEPRSGAIPVGEDTRGKSAAPPESPVIGTFHSLHFRSFRFLWIGSFFSGAGQWIQQTSIYWIVYDITGSGSILGLVNAMRFVPMLLLAPVSGVAADRMDRRKLMVASEILLILVLLGLAAGLTLGQVQVWHLFAFTLLAGTAMIMGGPARQTLAFDLVPRSAVPNAVSLLISAMSFTRILGPSVAGYMIAYLGPEGSFFTIAAAHVGVTITIFMIAFPPRSTPSRQRGSFLKEAGEGIGYVVKEPNARGVVLLAFLAPLFLIPSFTALMPIFAKDVFHTGPAGLGLLLSSVGLGGLLGALFTASLGHYDRRGLLALGSLMLFSLSMLGFALSPSMAVALPLLVLAGFAEMTYMTTNQTMLQLMAPDHMRGRVISVLSLTPAGISAGSLTAGVGADLVGAPSYAATMAVVAAMLGLLMAVATPRVRNLRLAQYSKGAPAPGLRHG
ncbi:MAG: MFS transporter [Chloroflexi bacterium]|nr:MFS transporter [Chloroflexota bacterium]